MGEDELERVQLAGVSAGLLLVGLRGLPERGDQLDHAQVRARGRGEAAPVGKPLAQQTVVLCAAGLGAVGAKVEVPAVERHHRLTGRAVLLVLGFRLLSFGLVRGLQTAAKTVATFYPGILRPHCPTQQVR